MRSNIKTKLKILNTYMFSILNYGCESWLWNAAMHKKLDVVLQKISECKFVSWMVHVSKAEVLKRLGLHSKLAFQGEMMGKNLKYTRYVQRGSSDYHIYSNFRRSDRGRESGCFPRRTQMKGIPEWMDLNAKKVIAVKNRSLHIKC